jgi:chemotaxis protein methyltransferase CheR
MMADVRTDTAFLPTMSDRVFSRLAEFLNAALGIKLPPEKRVMLQSRVLKRLRILGLRSYDDYCDFLFTPQGQREEFSHLIDVTTTNKTDFFREAVHFDVLRDLVLPGYREGAGLAAERPLVVWSAGCSTGEEPYTLALVLSEFRELHPGFPFWIMASDISTRVLETARQAVYPESRIDVVPMPLRRKYFLRSRDRARQEVRLTPSIRSRVHFFRLNLMDEQFVLPARVDIIFCRNVLIYFSHATQENLVRRFFHNLNPGGYLFTGHSETLCNMSVPFETVVPTVYRRKG